MPQNHKPGSPRSPKLVRLGLLALIAFGAYGTIVAHDPDVVIRPAEEPIPAALASDG